MKGSAALERALLEALARRRPDIALSLEMFERDTQAALPAGMHCPKDAYFDRFVESMSGHPAREGPDAAATQSTIVERYYQAQCLKDEVMGESIARVAKGPEDGPLIVHYTGAFHSGFALGAAERAAIGTTAERLACVWTRLCRAGVAFQTRSRIVPEHRARATEMRPHALRACRPKSVMPIAKAAAQRAPRMRRQALRG